MDCEKVRALLPFYIMSDLGEDEREAVRAHVESCGGCADELDALGELVEQLAADRPADPGEHFWTEFEASVMEKVEALERGRPWSALESVTRLIFPFPEMHFARKLAYAASIVAVAILGSLFAWRAHLRYTQPFEETAASDVELESSSVTGFAYTDYLEELTGDELQLVSRAVSGWGVEVSPSTHDLVSEMTGEGAYEIYAEIESMEQEELNLLDEAIEKWERSAS